LGSDKNGKTASSLKRRRRLKRRPRPQRRQAQAGQAEQQRDDAKHPAGAGIFWYTEQRQRFIRALEGCANKQPHIRRSV
jgi:hypothetical protein